MGRRRRGDVDAVARGNELVRRGRARRLREGVGEPIHGARGWVPDPGDGDGFRIMSDGGAKQPLAHDAVADDPQPDRTQILLLRLDDSARATLATASMAEAGRRIAPALDSRAGSVIVSAKHDFREIDAGSRIGSPERRR